MLRTNNRAEGFHTALSNTLQENRPNTWKFIRRLHSEEILAKLKCCTLKEANRVILRRSTETSIQDCLKSWQSMTRKISSLFWKE